MKMKNHQVIKMDRRGIHFFYYLLLDVTRTEIPLMAGSMRRILSRDLLSTMEIGTDSARTKHYSSQTADGFIAHWISEKKKLKMFLLYSMYVKV